MGVILGPDRINKLVVNSITTIQLPFSNLITLGGQQFNVESKIMDSDTVGLGGMDVGSLVANLQYNIFAVRTGASVGLVSSLSQAPIGFLIFKLVGSFEVNSTAEIVNTFDASIVRKYQINFLPASLSSSTNDISTLRFSNLDPGKTYRLTMMCRHVAGAQNSTLTAYHDGNQLLINKCQPDAIGPEDREQFASVHPAFVATATTVTFDFFELSNTVLEGDGTSKMTFVVLEELPNHVPTTRWT